MDYVDGVLEERNVGEMDHATVQKLILLALSKFEEAAGVYAIQEVRVQVSETRFRVPDVCLVSANNILPEIVQEPPLLCVEVLSPKDTLSRMPNRCMDYVTIGVSQVWIFNPVTGYPGAPQRGLHLHGCKATAREIFQVIPLGVFGQSTASRGSCAARN